MKSILILMLMPILALAQTKKEVVEFNNSIILPFNKTTNSVLNFNMALLQGAAPNVLISKRDLVLSDLKALDKVLLGIKPIQNDYGILAATKGGAATYKVYFAENYTNEKLTVIPSSARDNIKKITEAKEASKKMDDWNADFSKRQKKLLAAHKIESNIDEKTVKRAEEHKAAMNFYYEVSLNEFRVQQYVDDFVDAFNADEKEKIKIAQTNLKTQLAISDKYLGTQKPHRGDVTLISSSKKVTGFYKKLSGGLITDVLKLNSFPSPIPNEKVEEYNELVDKVNKGVEFLNSLQTYLNESQVVIQKFFQSHLY